MPGIGAELQGYVNRGLGGRDARGDGRRRRHEHRSGASGTSARPGVGLMVDARTFKPSEANASPGVEPFDVRWFEEPVVPTTVGAAAVRASTTTRLQRRERVHRFDFRDLIDIDAVDVLQPDLAICGGPTEAPDRSIGRYVSTGARPIVGGRVAVQRWHEPGVTSPGNGDQIRWAPIRSCTNSSGKRSK